MADSIIDSPVFCIKKKHTFSMSLITNWLNAKIGETVRNNPQIEYGYYVFYSTIQFGDCYS
ncbi:hypothetical protein ACFO5O_07575 [Geojedonia litorea]|uniref:Uncharacterized protein n=1 Tax=Geojedonia litorea TaxID=1268269 RepID=A0ABV9N3J6_9FLAO